MFNFIQFVVYSMRNPVVYRTAKKVVVVKGNGMRRNQSDCSKSDLDQSEGRIWHT